MCMCVYTRPLAAPAASFLWARALRIWRYCCNLHKHCVNIGTSTTHTNTCTHIHNSLHTHTQMHMCVYAAFDQKIVIEAQLLPASSTSSLNNSRRGVQREWRKRECGWESKYKTVRMRRGGGGHRIERLSSLATKRKWKPAVVKGKKRKREREGKMKIKQSLHLSRTQPQSQRCQLQ